MKTYISSELDKRFAEYQSNENPAGSRSIIDLVLESYMSESPSSKNSKHLDPTFKSWATTQIRLFLFAGHDSTSSTICYCFYLLSKHPDALSRIRSEHDSVFGTDLSTVPTQLNSHPHLINALPYTLAVIKESLRLFPPASAFRGGLPGISLQHPTTGTRYPTEGMNIWVLHNALHRNPTYWKDPNSFIPERWLVGPQDPLYPVKGGWRPFEFGARNCIGQALVMLDVRIVLAMTLRGLEVRDAYEEWDLKNPGKAHGVKTVNGERAYQVSAGGAHPADGFPCRVSVRTPNAV
jgi:cytochrome P450